jgi:hypothetical protein
MTVCEVCRLTYDGPEEFPGVHINHLHALLSCQRADLEETVKILSDVVRVHHHRRYHRKYRPLSCEACDADSRAEALLARLREGKG